ncbi:nucleotidyltransferase domain-containing protein [Natrinema sp. H-ect4]|uniref:nucleotidyltransferase domain-containing protein n=1 Tax=Natrinema sp. H-ect4 TaxID=3242699 RepID=UPI0035A84547
MSEKTKRGIKVCIDPHPGSDREIFRTETADDILRLLVDAHETEFTIPEFVDATGAARSTVWRAVTLLDDIGAARVRETPQRNYVSIDPRHLHKDDPILAIEQPVFHEPIRTFVDRVRQATADDDDIDEVYGIIVFGSVARGEADRRSDIDLFVVVDGDRTSARRLVTDVVSELNERRFDGDRFDFEPYVESIESTRRAGPKLREIFTDGITVYGDDRLQSIRKEVFVDE